MAELRQPLPGLALAAAHETRFGDWGNEEIKWREVSGLNDTVLSMDIPPIQGDGGTTKTRTVESPIWTKDLTMGGRKMRQMALSGFDPILFREMAEAMAVDISSFVLKGATAGTGGLSSDIKGLINHSGIGTVTGGDWRDPEVMNDDLGEAFANLGARRQGGPSTLLMNIADSDVTNTFLPAGGGTRIGQNLPTFVRRILFEEDTSIVPTGEAYLINDSRRSNYDVVSPLDGDGMRFGLGNVTAGDPEAEDRARGLGGTRMQEMDNMMKTRTIRFLNILTMRVNRDTDSTGGNRAFTEKISFQKS